MIVARGWLRTEGLAIGLAGLAAAWWLGAPFWPALAVLVAPDIAIAAYAIGPRPGALAYNAAHSYVGPAVAAVLLVTSGAAPEVAGLCAVWAAHIGLDRALGYGLKGADFKDTHLGRIGRG